ncbi:MAG: CRISPR-associated protein Cas4 [Cyclobacteriaceae bacterium]
MTRRQNHNFFREVNTTGTIINYYFVCKRELWLFSRGLQCEDKSDLVTLGRLLHEDSYKKSRKEFQFGSIKVDWIDMKSKIIHETKKSNKAEEAHRWQLKYYLYFLKQNGIGEFKGELNYPKLNKKEKVTLAPGDDAKIEMIIDNIDRVTSSPEPPPVINAKICRSCSYMELCYI